MQTNKHPEVGDSFRCAWCGKRDVVKTPHSEMVALYEIMTGREYDPDDKNIRMSCDECDAKIHRKGKSKC